MANTDLQTLMTSYNAKYSANAHFVSESVWGNHLQVCVWEGNIMTLDDAAAFLSAYLAA